MDPARDAPEDELVLRSLGAGSELLQELAAELSDAPPGARPGRVVRVDRGRFTALTAEGPVAVATTGVAPVCVGDWCILSRAAEDAGTTTSFELHVLLPRRTALVRQSSGQRVASQALAANMDTVMVVVPLDRPISRRQVERFLVLAWDSGAAPVIVLTKADLVDAETAQAASVEVAAVSGALDILLVSTVSGAGIGDLGHLVGPGLTAALLGTSGSGKSSLVNALVGADTVPTGDVRQGDAKGRHTTTWRELVVVPTGGALIDTPGLRELGMWVDEEGIDAAFADITDLEGQCRFNDCAHDGEPGCAVLAAIADGTLDVERLTSYRTLLGEAAHAARKNDHRLAKEAQKIWKQRSVEARRRPPR